MEGVTFKQRVCEHYGITEERFSTYVLHRVLFTRALFLAPFFKVFIPDIYHHEEHLMTRVGRTTTLRELQEEIDFYQHKYIVNSVFKDALKFRISGMKLMKFGTRIYGGDPKNTPRKAR